jgi:hypothetical protein
MTRLMLVGVVVFVTHALEAIIESKQGETKARWWRGARDPALNAIHHRVIIETQADHFLQDFHDGRGQNVHAEEAQVVTRAQAGDDELLLGHGGRRFFDDLLNLVEAGFPLQPSRADRAVVGQLAFVRSCTAETALASAEAISINCRAQDFWPFAT